MCTAGKCEAVWRDPPEMGQLEGIRSVTLGDIRVTPGDTPRFAVVVCAEVEEGQVALVERDVAQLVDENKGFGAWDDLLRPCRHTVRTQPGVNSECRFKQRAPICARLGERQASLRRAVVGGWGQRIIGKVPRTCRSRPLVAGDLHAMAGGAKSARSALQRRHVHLPTGYKGGSVMCTKRLRVRYLLECGAAEATDATAKKNMC